jgi:hypothetical protein
MKRQTETDRDLLTDLKYLLNTNPIFFYRFTDVEISEIHLSQRRAGRRSAEGYYLPSTILSITTCG